MQHHLFLAQNSGLLKNEKITINKVDAQKILKAQLLNGVIAISDESRLESKNIGV